MSCNKIATHVISHIIISRIFILLYLINNIICIPDIILDKSNRSLLEICVIIINGIVNCKISFFRHCNDKYIIQFKF